MEDIKSRLSVEDVVADYVQLKRSGRNFKGLSPWTNEKTPSLMVSPEKQIWHDFSSGKGGNIYSFVMEMEGVDFRRALEILARKAGVDLDQYDQQRGRSDTKSKERLYEANELAARYYQRQLTKSKPALEYLLKQRKLAKQTLLDFRLGFAPETSSALSDALKKKGFSLNELQRAGLATARGSDMFRGRIMIPLADQQGRIIGFTGRMLSDKASGPKYLNTPASPIYDKSRHVYGLHLAKEAIRKQNFAVAVEGNMDVIASHQANVTNAVATAGTAMTEYHLKTLGRFTPDIRLAFDADDAGIAATERIIPLADKAGVQLTIIDLAGAKDPDELAQKDPKLWQKAVTKNQDVLDWLIAKHQDKADLSSYAGREEFKKAVLSALSKVKSRGEQQRYATKVAGLLGYSPDAVLDEMAMSKDSQQTYSRRQPDVPKVTAQQTEYKKLQDHLLALALYQPELRQNLSLLTPEMLTEEPAKTVLKWLQSNPEAKLGKTLPMSLHDIGDYVRVLTLEYEELYQRLELVELRYEAARLQVRMIEHYVKRQKEPLSASLRSASDSQADSLLQKAKTLDELLKKSKEINQS